MRNRAATPNVKAQNKGPVRALRPFKKDVKYITGRFGRADVERLALLRARLNLDNSALLNRAVSELYERCINIELEQPLCKSNEERKTM